MIPTITSYLFIDILLLIIPLLLFGIYKIKKKYDYFKDRGMPYYKAGFSVINLSVLMMKENIEDYLDKIYRKMEGYKYAGIPGIIGKPTILLIDPELVEKVLIKDFSNFHDRINIDIDIKKHPLDANLFNLKGQVWRTLRAKLSPTFTSGKLKWMFSQISTCTDILIEQLNEKSNGQDFLIRETISCYGFDVIASCAFGIDSQTQKNPHTEFRQKATKIFKPSTLTIMRSIVRFAFPKVAKVLGIKSTDPETSDFFSNLTKTALQHRKESGYTRNDFVQLLLQLKEKGSVEYEPEEASEIENSDLVNEKLEFTDDLLTAQAFIFFLAGFEPVATLIIYSLYALSKNDKVQSKVRDEISQVKSKHGGHITYDSLKQMDYLEAIMAETLRLYSPARLIMRTCNKSYKLEDGNVIEKGTSIMIPNYSLQRDSKYFNDPEEFIPERFADGEQLSIRQGHGMYIPFGDGPRMCIARRFALLEAKLALARIVECYQLCHSHKNIEPIRRNPKSFTLEPISGLWLRMNKINLESPVE